MRIDKLLWHLRLVKTRARAQMLVAAGHVRRNGARVLRASQPIAPGDTMTLPLPSGVVVIEVLALPARRGPAAEARDCYRVLDPAGESAIAPDPPPSPGRGPQQ